MVSSHGLNYTSFSISIGIFNLLLPRLAIIFWEASAIFLNISQETKQYALITIGGYNRKDVLTLSCLVLALGLFLNLCIQGWFSTQNTAMNLWLNEFSAVYFIFLFWLLIPFMELVIFRCCFNDIFVFMAASLNFISPIMLVLFVITSIIFL